MVVPVAGGVAVLDQQDERDEQTELMEGTQRVTDRLLFELLAIFLEAALVLHEHSKNQALARLERRIEVPCHTSGRQCVGQMCVHVVCIVKVDQNGSAP